MKTRKIIAAAAIAVAGTLALGGCAAGGGGGQNADGSVTLTFWHNSTTGDGKKYWEDTAAAFEAANPGVTIEIQSLQNEEMDGKLQTALNSGDAPDIFMARGGGKLADIVKAGQAMDLTDKISADVKTALGGSLGAFE
ncbi:extracellular solute-binding protein, partial [Microbacterium sp. Bi128]|uniref:extracellular solute-binding protein n=1 Tax=Microbacterium sp. Bi128 TaxID=2821115 RepID=UPI001E41EAD3